MATNLLFGNMKLTCIKAGADNIFTGLGDETFMTIRGFGNPLDINGTNSLDPTSGGRTLDVIKSNGKNARFEPMQSGEIGRVRFQGAASVEAIDGATFKVVDQDFSDVFEGGLFPNDLIGSTSYKATGNEPLIGQNPFFFVNFMKGGGSEYKFEYNVVRFPTTGKLASEKGGVLNGKNTDGTLLGQGGKDVIYANDGDDIVLGRGNNDKLYGGKGDDVVWGGKGYDRVSGGAGKDTFVVAQKTGLDTITDFRVGTDKIGLAYGLEYNDVSVWNKTGGTLLKAGSEQLAFLEGVNANQLGKSSFAYSDLAAVNGVADATFA